MDALLRAAGFVDVKVWNVAFEHRYDPDGFLAFRTSRGTSRVRFQSLSPDRQRTLLDRARTRFESLSPDDFVDRSSMIFAVGRKG